MRFGHKVLEYEILEEMAATLGRLGRNLKDALEQLRAADATGSGAATRHALVDNAAQALWEFIVHREACGRRAMIDQALEDYKVPGEVRARVGAVTRSNAGRTTPAKRR